MANIALFALYTLSSAVGLLLIKQFIGPAQSAWRSASRMDLTMLYVSAGAALYILSFVVWLTILARNQLTVAYPIAIGLTLIASTIGSWLFLHEPIGALRLLGIGAILVGAMLVVRS